MNCQICNKYSNGVICMSCKVKEDDLLEARIKEQQKIVDMVMESVFGFKL